MHNLTIYTIGHSNQDAGNFIELLKTNSIEVVADVRSSPYSKYASQFNKKEIVDAQQSFIARDNRDSWKSTRPVLK